MPQFNIRFLKFLNSKDELRRITTVNRSVLSRLVEKEIITDVQKEEILHGLTNFDQADKLFVYVGRQTTIDNVGELVKVFDRESQSGIANILKEFIQTIGQRSQNVPDQLNLPIPGTSGSRIIPLGLSTNQGTDGITEDYQRNSSPENLPILIDCNNESANFTHEDELHRNQDVTDPLMAQNEGVSSAQPPRGTANQVRKSTSVDHINPIYTHRSCNDRLGDHLPLAGQHPCNRALRCKSRTVLGLCGCVLFGLILCLTLNPARNSIYANPVAKNKLKATEPRTGVGTSKPFTMVDDTIENPPSTNTVPNNTQTFQQSEYMNSTLNTMESTSIATHSKSLPLKGVLKNKTETTMDYVTTSSEAVEDTTSGIQFNVTLPNQQDGLDISSSTMIEVPATITKDQTGNATISSTTIEAAATMAEDQTGISYTPISSTTREVPAIIPEAELIQQDIDLSSFVDLRGLYEGKKGTHPNLICNTNKLNKSNLQKIGKHEYADFVRRVTFSGKCTAEHLLGYLDIFNNTQVVTYNLSDAFCRNFKINRSDIPKMSNLLAVYITGQATTNCGQFFKYLAMAHSSQALRSLELTNTVLNSYNGESITKVLRKVANSLTNIKFSNVTLQQDCTLFDDIPGFPLVKTVSIEFNRYSSNEESVRVSIRNMADIIGKDPRFIDIVPQDCEFQAARCNTTSVCV